MTAIRKAAQAGLTLIELMVVVAIVGILMLVAVVTIDRDPTVRDVGHRLVNFIQEGSRKAIAAGAVAPEVVTAFGEDARIKVEISTDGTTGLQVVRMYRLDESLYPGDAWAELTARYISDGGIRVHGYTLGLDNSALELGTTPDTVLGAGSVEFLCRPDGTCDGITLYLQHESDVNAKARIRVMPLNGTAYVFSGW